MEKNENFKSQLETQYNILIKASEKKEQKRYICILIILISTLISVIISITIAYQAFKNSKEANQSDDTINTYYETLSVVYNGSNTLDLTNIGNGYNLSTPRTIQVTNEGNVDIDFDINLKSIKTSLLSTNNLIYTINSDDNETINKELPLNDKVLISNQKISPGETITYTIMVNFNGTMESNNYSNYYNAKLSVEPKNNKSDLLE